MSRGRLPTFRPPFMRQVQAATNRRHFVRCSLSNQAHGNQLDVSAGEEQTRGERAGTATAVTMPLTADEGPADVQALGVHGNSQTHRGADADRTADGRQHLTADADQASTSQDHTTTAQPAHDRAHDPRGPRQGFNARSNPTPYQHRLAAYPVATQVPRITPRFQQLTKKPINSSQQA